MTQLSLPRNPPVAPLVLPRLHIAARLAGPVSLVAGPLALGMALQVNYGQYHPAAFGWLTVALLACIIAQRRLLADAPFQQAPAYEPALRMALAVGLAIQFWLLLTTSPMATLVVRSARDLLPFRLGVIVAAACTAFALKGNPVERTFLSASRVGGMKQTRMSAPPSLALIGILSTYLLLGLWVLRVAPPPPVDVCLFQREACRALLAGHNPYAITFAMPYDVPARIYGPGTFANGRLLFGYPYPPLSLLLILPGYLLGDFRYAHLAAMTLAGALIALARPGRIATAAAALLLFTPRGFFVLEAGWTEPLAILMLAAAVFAACRAPRLSPLCLGLLLMTKQYLILAAPLASILGETNSSRQERQGAKSPKKDFPFGICWHSWSAGVLGAIPLLVSLPLIFWNVPAFVHSAVMLQFHQPMRMDALSYAPWFAMHGGPRLPAWVPFAAVAAIIAMVLRRRTKIPATFPAGVALVFFVFFALNKQAFCNYYLFVIAAMCCAAAVATPVTTDSSPERI